MPSGDRTGPMGMGPMTGRRAGFCAGYDSPGYVNDTRGRGFGYGFGGGGFGRGRRNRHYPADMIGRGQPGWGSGQWAAPNRSPITQEQELNTLKEQAGYIENTLSDIQKRIDELENKEK